MVKEFKYFSISLIFCLSNLISVAQDKTVDSLVFVLKTNISDTSKLSILFQLAETINDEKVWPLYNERGYELAKKLAQSADEKIRTKGKKGIGDALNNFGFIAQNKGDLNKALQYHLQSLKIRQAIGDKLGIATTYNNLGLIYYTQGNISKAVDHWNKSLQMEKENGNKKGIAQMLNNIGSLYSNQGDIPKALEYWDNSLKIRESIGDKIGIASSLNSIGYTYCSQGDAAKALKYYTRSLKLNEEMGSKEGVAIILHNIGYLYYKVNNDIPLALDHFNRSLKLREEIGYKTAIASSLRMIGDVYFSQKKTTEALDYFKKSLVIERETGSKDGLAESFINLGRVYFAQKKFSSARYFSDSSLVLSKELGFAEKIRNAEGLLTKIDSSNGNFKSAFAHYKQYITKRDVIANEESRKASIKSQLKYEYDKKESVIKEQQEKERAVAEEKNRFQQIVIGVAVLGLLLVIVFAAFVYRSLKITNKQKHIIEEKQREILDSIHYAKKIQNALMTNENYIERSLNKLNRS